MSLRISLYSLLAADVLTEYTNIRYPMRNYNVHMDLRSKVLNKLQSIPQYVRLPLAFAVFYLLMILVFATGYLLSGLEIECENEAHVKADIWDCLYFSVVTITTLGYGDITPTGFIQKSLVMVETIVGVLAFGMFLLVLGYELNNRQVAKAQQRDDELKKIYLAGFFRKYVEHISYFLNTYREPLGQDDKNVSETYFFKDLQICTFRTFNFDKGVFTMRTNDLIQNNSNITINTFVKGFSDYCGRLCTSLQDEVDRYRLLINDPTLLIEAEQVLSVATEYRSEIGKILRTSTMHNGNLSKNENWLEGVELMDQFFIDLTTIRNQYIAKSEGPVQSSQGFPETEKSLPRNIFREYFNL